MKSMLLGEEGLLRGWMSSEAEDAAELADLSPEEVAHRETLERFAERLTVEPVRNSYLFRVSYESFGRGIAADVANAVVDEYQRLSAQRRLNSTAGARQFLGAADRRGAGAPRDLREGAHRVRPHAPHRRPRGHRQHPQRASRRTQHPAHRGTEPANSGRDAVSPGPGGGRRGHARGARPGTH
ncbi:MAG: hypothetical protein M5U09_19690 [Gammaproteobacteria bacterium]|nr:hypothetical protein [Gammaproteobacteria bacterium]